MKQKKTIGIIGGISPMSTAVYYSRIATEFNNVMGGLNYPRMVLSSINMADINTTGQIEDEQKVLRVFVSSLMDMPSADFILVASNTMHKVVNDLKNLVDKDILDIRNVVADAVLQHGFHKILLLGSRQTMETAFYREYLQEKGLEIVVPDENERIQLNMLIYDDLCRGEISEEGNILLQNIVTKAVQAHAVEAVVLACTEFSLLKQEFCVPAFDSSELHVKAAVQKAIE